MSAAGVVPEQRPRHIYAVLAVGVISIASSAILVRFAQEGSPLAVASWRLVFAVLILAPFSIKSVPAQVRSFSTREHGLIVVSGIALGLHFATWIESLYLTSVASSTVLVTTSPVFLAILGFVVLGERLNRQTILAIAIAVVGSGLIAAGDSLSSDPGAGANPVLGNGLALAAAFLVSIYLLIGRSVRQHATWLGYVFPVYFVASLTTLAIASLRGDSLFGYSPGFYTLCLLMALIPQILGHGAFNYAVKYVPAVILGILTLAEPIVASIGAYVLFGEAPAWPALIGMVLVLLGVVMALSRPTAQRTRAGSVSSNL